MYPDKSRYYYETLLKQGEGKRKAAVRLVTFYAVIAALLLLLDLSGSSRGLALAGGISLLIVGAISAYHYSKAQKDIAEAQYGLTRLPPEEHERSAER